MKHATDDELILYFYGESRRAGQIDRHLGECAECASIYNDIAATLALVGTPETPARGEHYGEEVWQRIRHELPEQEPVTWLAWVAWRRALLTTACAALLAAVAAVGVAVHHRAPSSTGQPEPLAAAAADPHAADASERIRLAAISDHLEQSERVLMDVTNADGSRVDVSAQQASAESLIEANRFYRDAAAHAGENDVASLLDELERSLLDIAHGPSTLSAAERQRTLTRLDADALLFRIRVLSDELHDRQLARQTPDTPVKTRTTL